jgi:hypothetical protein
MPKSSAPLTLSVVGPPIIIRGDGQASEVSLRKPMSLLVYVAGAGRMVSREHIAHLFWSDARRQAHSVRQALWQLRSQLDLDLAPNDSAVRVSDQQLVLDIAELGSIQAASDAPRLRQLVRGAFCEGLDFSYSAELQDWFDDFRHRALDQLAAASRRVAAELVSEGRADEARALIQHVSVAGLSQVELRHSVFSGLDLLPEPGATQVGSTLLRDRIAALGDQTPQRLILIQGETEGVREAVAEACERRTEPISVVDFSAELGESEAQALGRLLDTLGSLPGGLGRSPRVEALRTALDEPAAAKKALEDRGDVGWILGDAIDAVRDETPTVLLLGMAELQLPFVDLVARGLRNGRMEGLLVVVWSPRAVDLVGPRAGALATSAEAVNRIDLRPQPLGGPVPAERPGGAAPSPAGSPEASAGQRSGVPANPRRHRVRALVASLVAVAVIVVGWATRSGVEAGPAILLPEHDLVLCTDVDGSPRLYFRSLAGGFIERVSIEGFFGCGSRGLWLQGLDRLIFLSAVAGPPEGRDTRVPQPSAVFDLTVFEPGATLREDWSSRQLVEGGLPHLLDMDHVRAYQERWLLVWSLDDAGRYGVEVVDARDGSVTQVASDLDIEPEARWHAERPLLLWSVDQDGRGAIWGSPWPDVAPRPVLESDLPLRVRGSRGDTILVERGRLGDDEDGGLEIGFMRLSQPTAFEPLTDDDHNDHDASWSSDGRFICWTSEERGHFASNVRLLDRESGELYVLDSESRRGFCEFAPDNRGMFFREYRGDATEIHYYEPGMQEPIVVSDLPGQNLLVDFVPIFQMSGDVVAQRAP